VPSGQPSEPVPPLAVQEVAPVVIQDSAAAPPAVMVGGVAVKATKVGAAGGALTVTLTEAGVPTPPVPEQVSV
jgi:hypothetical protein